MTGSGFVGSNYNRSSGPRKEVFFCVRPDGFDGEDFDDLSREQFFHECVGLDFVELHGIECYERSTA